MSCPVRVAQFTPDALRAPVAAPKLPKLPRRRDGA